MVWLIAKREFRTRTLSKANIISSSIMIVLIVAAAMILKPFLTGDDEPALVEVDTATAELIPYLESSAQAQDANYAFEETDVSPPAADGEMPDGVHALVAGEPISPELYLGGGDETLSRLVGGASQAVALDAEVSALGGDPAVVGESLAAAEPTVTMVGDTSEFDGGTFFAGLVVIVVLFVILIQSASVIMMGVVEEKSSRVVEILLATVRPATLLGGKVLGVGLYALVQAASMVVPLLFAAWYLDLLSTLEIEMGPLLVNFAVWFVLGFAVFTVFFGGLAALVSRQEDIGAVTTPMMLLMMVPLYLAIYLVPNNPDGMITQVLTYVPFFAPFLVPMRAAFGEITTAEVAISIVICVISIPVLTWIAGRVYAGAVLNTGGRMKLRDALRQG
ncbi:ABC transporter permease [Demequina sp. NBRC 110053]|uniref:ABC transporter permease n=1 Tax=Demequina sp. NBRC 110053 TaxID=1570342 RepID=UPI000A023846|nr:ABC transporter permease [Demequina sp. NBRC 110053]